MRALLVLALLAGGCLPPDDQLPDEEAIAIVLGVYGAADIGRPAVWWRTDLDCGDGNVGWVIKLDGQPACIGGIFRPAWEIQVARVPGQALSDSHLAHELLHFVHYHRGRRDGPAHGPDFGPGGLVERANEALRAAGH